MPIREIPGLSLEHLPGNGTAPFCHVCGRLYDPRGGGLRCHAVPERKPRQRKNRPGAPCCGTCWEDPAQEAAIRDAVERAGKPALYPVMMCRGMWDIAHAASGGQRIPAGLPSRKVCAEVCAQVEALPGFSWRHPNPIATNPQPIFDLIKTAKDRYAPRNSSGGT